MPRPKQKQSKKKNIGGILLKYVTVYFKLIPPTLLILILILGYFLLIKPKYDQIIQVVETTNTQQENEFAKTKEYFDNLILLQRNYQKLDNDDIEKINKLLPGKPEIENLLVMIETLANKNNFLIGSIQASWDEKESKNIMDVNKQKLGIREVNVTLPVSEIDYNGFKKLLNVIENNLRIFDIRTISFSPKGNSANLQFVTYYLD